MYSGDFVHLVNSSNVSTSMIDLVGGNSPYSSPDNLSFDPVSLMKVHLTTKRLAVAFFSVVIYEFLITLGQGIDLFWTHRLSISKVLFILNRVNGALFVAEITLQNLYANAPIKYCAATPWLELALSTAMIAVFNMVLLIRVYALWNRSPYVYYVCIAVYAMNIGSYIGISAYSNSKALISSNVAPFTGCLVIPGYSKEYVIFITSIAFESFVILLTVMKAWPVARQRVKMPLLNLLLEDGLGYYACIIISQIITIIAVFSSNFQFSLPIFGSFPSCAILIIGCNRLLLRPQQLLLIKGSDMPSEFHSSDLRTIGPFSRKKESNSGFTLSRDLPGERLELNNRRGSASWIGTGSRLSRKRASVVHIDAGVLTDHAHQPTSPTSPGYPSGGSLDKDVDVAGHYLTGITVEREDVQQVEGGRASGQEDLVPLPERGPFNYGSRRHVLDSNAVMPETDGKTGQLTVSRLGRYD